MRHVGGPLPEHVAGPELLALDLRDADAVKEMEQFLMTVNVELLRRVLPLLPD